MQTDTIVERVAHNQDVFRRANEGIEDAAWRIGPDAARVPFICECPDPSCTEVASLTLMQYETVRSSGEAFLVVPGHETCVVDGVDVARVFKRYDGFTVMKKIGEAGEIAAMQNPRAS